MRHLLSAVIFLAALRCSAQGTNLVLSGPDTTYYHEGQVSITGSWKEGERDGPWTGFYP